MIIQDKIVLLYNPHKRIFYMQHVCKKCPKINSKFSINFVYEYVTLSWQSTPSLNVTCQHN